MLVGFRRRFRYFVFLQDLDIASRQLDLELELRGEAEQNDDLVSGISSQNSGVCFCAKSTIVFILRELECIFLVLSLASSSGRTRN